MDINLNRDIIIDIDLNNGEIDEPYNASYYNTDSNIAFFYVKLHKMNAFNFTEYISKEDAGNYKVVMKIVKPKTLIVTELIGTISDDLDEDCAIYKFIIKDELMNEVGEPFCYISIYYNNQELVTNGFNYTIKQDPLGKYNLVLLNDPDMPLLKSLLEEIKNNVGGIDDENVRDDKSFSSYKTTQIANNLSSQIKEKATKEEVDIERKRIDTFTSLAQGSTTGDAELIDARIGSDNYVYPNLGSSIREQVNKLQNQLNLNYHNIYNKHANSNFYYNKDGSTTQTGGSHQITEKYSINSSTDYFYTGINNPKTFIYTHFFDSKDKSVGYLLLETGLNKLDIPNGASKIAFSIAKEDVDSFSFIQEGYVLNMLSEFIKSKGIINDSSKLYKDFNGVPINSIITYNCNNQVNNSPISITKGCLLTIHGRDEFNGGVTQLFISNIGDFYYRIYFSDVFTSWKKIVDEDRCNTIVEHRCNSIVKENIDNSYNFIALFENIGIIGDSWASGYTYPNGKGTNNYSISWGQIMARKNGVNVTNFSKGGLSTKTWLDDNKGDTLLQSENAKNLYLIALGINDATAIDNGDMNLGSISDIDTNNYNNNANTFYGYYGKIVSKIKEKAPNGKIILITIPRTDKTTYATLNEAIINIANLFNIPYIVSLDKSLFTSDLFNNTKVNAHPTAVGYSAMADAYTKLITECIINNYEYFIDYYGN